MVTKYPQVTGLRYSLIWWQRHVVWIAQAVVSCWDFMGLGIYFDDRSIERLTSIQLPSSMTLSPASRATWLLGHLLLQAAFKRSSRLRQLLVG